MNIQEDLNITNSVIRIVKSQFNSSDELNTVYSLEKMGMDSLQCMRIVIQLETEFSIEIEGDDLLLENFRNIHTIAELVNKRLSMK